MTNLEKYFDELNSALINSSLCLPCIVARLRLTGGLKAFICNNNTDSVCKGCKKNSIEWLLSEYQPHELKNGNGLTQGQEIEVSWKGNDKWQIRKFIAYADGLFWCYKKYSEDEAVGWEHARLPEKSTID